MTAVAAGGVDTGGIRARVGPGSRRRLPGGSAEVLFGIRSGRLWSSGRPPGPASGIGALASPAYR